MALDKRNISISFGQGVDLKTDPNQVQAGKLLLLNDATLSQTLQLNKRNGYQPLATYTTSVASSSLQNQKLAVFNEQLLVFDGKSCQSISGGSPVFIDNFIAASPNVSTIARETGPLINQDATYNSQFDTTAYIWSSSCIAPNFQQLSFAGASGKFQIFSNNGTVLASTAIFNFVKNRVFSFGNNYYWTGINYPSSTLQYYQVPANGSSAYFNLPQTIGTGAVGGDFPANPLVTGFNRYQRYDGAVLNNNLYIGWFQPATSSINISLITQGGVTLTNSFKGDASGALGVFGDNNYVWLVYHDGATSAGFAVFNTSGLVPTGPPATSGINKWYTTDPSTLTNVPSLPQLYTGVSNGLQANVYTQNINYYPQTQIAPGVTISWPSAERTDFIWRQGLNGNTGATSGSSAVVMRGVGLGSKAFNSLGDDYLLASYGGTQTSTSADRLEPTNFLITPTKATNNIVAKIAFTNACGYDLATGGQSFYLNNNYGSVGYGLPLPQPFSMPANPLAFNIPYLLKTAAITLSSTSLAQPFFISQNFGVNSVAFDFNSKALYSGITYGNNLNVAGGYLAAFDGKFINEQNFHLFPEDTKLVGSSSFGPPANTYAYQQLYEFTDTQGNIFRSAPSKTYSITTGGSSAIYLSTPTLRATNKQGVRIRTFRNAPSIDPLTFHDISPLNPALNNPNLDNLVIVDSLTDAQIIGNPTIYTSGGVLEDTGVPSPGFITTYKLRVMVLDLEQNIWWYSKEVIPGATVELSDLQTFFVSDKFGKSTCGIEMADKFILFTRSMDGSLGAIYYMVGEGPSPNGENNDFSLPNLISSTLTTNNPNSLVLTPDGVMFQSDKGIWVLGYDLSLEYIGADVEGLTKTAKVTSASVIPNTTEVRFTLDSGIAIVFDYFQKQWSIFSNISATHGLLYQGLFTYLNQSASLCRPLQETLGQYLDINRPVLMGLTMSWFSFAGFQGYQRAYRAYLLGQSLSPHLLNVSIAYDFNQSPSQTAVVRPLSNNNQAWGLDIDWGSIISGWGGAQQLNQARINFTKQKCQSVQISIQESLDPTNIVYGPGPVLEAIGVVIGGKLSYPKLPARQTVK